MRWASVIPILWLCALAFAWLPLIAQAQVYRCTASNARVAFQDQPCAPGQAQTVMSLPSHAPQGYVPPPVATSLSPAVANSLPAPANVPPPAPLPIMYACVGAVNGKHYLTRHPPPPYLAPLGVMGYPPQTLVEAYGAPGGVGMSAPEVAPKPRIGGPAIAAAMTEVQDFCAPAPKTEICAYVRREYDDNDRKLRLAMPHEQPPYAQREQQLQEQLRNCH